MIIIPTYLYQRSILLSLIEEGKPNLLEISGDFLTTRKYFGDHWNLINKGYTVSDLGINIAISWGIPMDRGAWWTTGHKESDMTEWLSTAQHSSDAKTLGGRKVHGERVRKTGFTCLSMWAPRNRDSAGKKIFFPSTLVALRTMMWAEVRVTVKAVPNEQTQGVTNISSAAVPQPAQSWADRTCFLVFKS